MDTYRTVSAEAQAEFTERRSRFIGRIVPVTTEEAAQTYIAGIRKTCWDATHNVWAYVLREGQIRRYSDDGEPQGTAGVPVLDVLQKQGLTDCAVVVTRYFGGILLGAGGLVRAYSHGAALAAEQAGICEMRMCEERTLTCDYGQYGYVPALIAAHGGVLTDTAFEDAVTLRFYVPQAESGGLDAALTERSAGTLAAPCMGTGYRPFSEKT